MCRIQFLPNVQIAVAEIPNSIVVCCSQDVNTMRECTLLRQKQATNKQTAETFTLLCVRIVHVFQHWAVESDMGNK